MTVHITSVALSYGADEVLSDVSAIVRPRDRTALVGRNGAGKTTLLRLVAGELKPDRGEIAITTGTRVALHDQRPPLVSDITLGGYVGEGAAVAERLERELRELELRMAGGETDPALLRRYDAAQREFERAGGYGWRSRLESVARGLGFGPDDLDRPLQSFSGGELTRASLTRALAIGARSAPARRAHQPPRHLGDRVAGGASSTASTPRAVRQPRSLVLESVANGVLEIDRGRGRFDKGSYSHWRALKAERLSAQADAFERQQAELAHLQRFVDRFRYGTKSRQAQSKLKAMARIERVDRPCGQRTLRFRFPKPVRSGRVVVEAEGLDRGVGGAGAGEGRVLRDRARASGWRCSAPTAPARRRCSRRCSAAAKPSTAGSNSATTSRSPTTRSSRSSFPTPTA